MRMEAVITNFNIYVDGESGQQLGLARGLVVVTSNVGEFKRVSGLQVEDWR